MRKYSPHLRRSFFLIILVLFCCKSIPFNPESAQQNFVAIGNGGGITGIETRYFFTVSGEVFVQNGFDTVSQRLPSIDRKLVSQAINTIEKLDLINYRYQKPGNVYKFLEIKLNGQENRIVWGSISDEVSPVSVSLYQILKQSLE